MKKLGFIFILFFFVMALSAQTSLDTAQNFTVKDIYGNTFELYDILDSGKIVVIDFFATT
ncbi:MAG: hypothetical protein R2750_10520 [Bacteroidales bacterium]